MTELKTTTFDNESQTAIRLSVENAKKTITALAIEPVDVAIAGVRVYLACAEMLGGHLKQARFVSGTDIITIGVSVQELPEGEDFTSNEIDRDAQMELGASILDGFDDAVEDGVVSGYEQGAMLIAALHVLYLGLKDSDIKELRFRHNKRNYVSNITLSPEGKTQ